MRSRGVTFRLVAGLALVGALAAPARSQVRSKRKELNRIQKELESTRREIEEFKNLEQTLGRELDRIESRSSEARRRISELKRGLGLAEDRRRELKSRLVAVGQASGFWTAAIDSELRLYAQSAASRSPAYGRFEILGESLRRSAILEKAQLISGLKGLGDRTALAEADTRRRAEDLRDKSRQAAAEQDNRRQEYQEKKAAREEARERLAAATRRARELEESARALTRLIRSMLSGAKPPKAGEADRLDRPRNSLPWPAGGSVVSSFGRSRNEELDAWVIHQGIRLETPPAAAVSAVEGGRVIFAGPFRSYGQVVILDHGEDFFSIYGELGAIRKSKGARVRSGEVIAACGQAKNGAAGSLYLELRRGTSALDPLLWLKKR